MWQASQEEVIAVAGTDGAVYLMMLKFGESQNSVGWHESDGMAQSACYKRNVWVFSAVINTGIQNCPIRTFKQKAQLVSSFHLCTDSVV